MKNKLVSFLLAHVELTRLFTILIILLSFQLVTLTSFAQYTKLHDFNIVPDGRNPHGSLTSDGTFLYGMTYQGGTNNKGTIFKIMPDGTGYAKILEFAGTAKGSHPFGSLLFDGTFLYGMTKEGGALDLGVIFKIKPDGTGFAKLLDFIDADAFYPSGTLISDGTFLYGVSTDGGSNNVGTIFKIMLDGTGFVKILDFAGGVNGASPIGDLVSDGTFLYGMTYQGGTNTWGTIYKIMPNGTGFTKLLDFTGPNGVNPYGSLIYDGIFLYGMTYGGGANGFGTIFKIKPDGTGYAKLLDFAGISNGRAPQGALTLNGGLLYGMTQYGGLNDKGTIFQIKPDGSGFINLLDFAFAANGALPLGSLISDGTFLYGMTEDGGVNAVGTIFKFALSPITGIEFANHNLKIYPNPFKDKLFVESPDQGAIEIQVIDAVGRIVKTFSARQTHSSLMLDNLAKGIYTLQIQKGAELYYHRVIKE